jgi:tetratricopeptide (TPR) repeat protein
VAAALNSLSGILTLEGKQADAEKANKEAFKVLRWVWGPNDGSEGDLFSRGDSFFEQGRLAEAETCFRQALAIRRKNNHDVDVALSALGSTLRRQQRYSEAEPLYRECLAMRETNCPNAWYTFYTREMLGATLLGKRKYDEAEPLLLSGYEGMKQREDKIRDRTKVLTETLQNLVQLFEATSRPEQAEEWRTKLNTFQAAGRKKSLPGLRAPPNIREHISPPPRGPLPARPLGGKEGEAAEHSGSGIASPSAPAEGRGA